MHQFIQFIHPGPQPKYGKPSTGTVPWNLTSNSHTRKFIINKGQCLTAKSLIPSEKIAFWGEWEPNSSFIKISANTPPAPIATNTIPAKPVTLPVLGTPHSTDPYVFDGSFFYTNCKQSTFHKILKSLTPGSLIAFGSNIDGDFCLDTLMVIQSSFDFTPTTFTSIHSPVPISSRFLNTVISPLIRACPTQPFCFYYGATYQNPLIVDKEPIYSLVPCTTGAYFSRPKINSVFINHSLNRGIKSSILSSSQILTEWCSIISQINNHALNLGVEIN